VNKLDKTLTQVRSYTATMKKESSIINPILELSGNVFTGNYVYISDFGRYYYIDDIETLNNGYIRLSLSVDVLMTYKDEIRNNQAIVNLSPVSNPYLNDNRYVVESVPIYDTINFNTSFSKELQYIFICAGGE
jgi:hypothetical protein